jgi:prophage antirepressor-like protein
MTNELTAFDFEESPVRVLMRNDEPWFHAGDVCRVLDIANSRDAIRGLDDDEKITVANADGNPRAGIPHSFNIISESGLYALIFTSRKVKARTFRKWVTAEVLPAIRKTGRYEAEEALQASERGRLARLRELLLCTGEDVRAKRLNAGQAQAIAITAQRYLESVKLEGEALGYEKMFGLQDGEAARGLLSPQRKADGRVQGVPQPELPGAEDGEPQLSGITTGLQEGLGGPASRTGGGLCEGEQAAGAGDFQELYSARDPH